MSRDIYYEREAALKPVKEAIASFQNLLEDSVHRFQMQTRSETPYKFEVIRQALLWRTKELADGSIAALEADNCLSAVTLARSLMETVAVQVELARITQKAGNTIAPEEIEDKVVRVIKGPKNQSQNLKFLSALTMIDQVDTSVRGYRKMYDHLSNYTHTSQQGVMMLFSDYDQSHQTSFGRYIHSGTTIQSEALEAIKLALFALTFFLQKQMAHMDAFTAACESLIKDPKANDAI